MLKISKILIVGFFVFGFLLSCAPIQLADDFQSQSFSHFKPEKVEAIDIDFFDLEEFHINKYKTDIMFIDPAFRSYLKTIPNRREFTSLYKKFKNHPELRRSQTALKRALAFYVKHKNGVIKCHSRLSAKTLRNRSHILITDYTIPHPENRFFILYLKSGQVSSSPAAHGYGSNRNCPGKHQVQCGSRVMKCKIPVRISNKPRTGATSKGFFITDEPYRSSQATFRRGSPRSSGNNAIRLDGLQYGVNHNARRRAVVFHRADYYKNICSSSAGCPAIKPSVFEKYKTNVDGGALLYIHTIEDKNNNKPPDCSSGDLI